MTRYDGNMYNISKVFDDSNDTVSFYKLHAYGICEYCGSWGFPRLNFWFLLKTSVYISTKVSYKSMPVCH